jgi:ribonuclease HII
MPPSLEREARLWHAGTLRVAGLDEAGRGAWAGPVVAAAVILPPLEDLPAELAGVDDSKCLSPSCRQELYHAIIRRALAWGVGIVPAQEIDRIGILPATRKAMELALASLTCRPDALLIDALHLPQVSCPQEAIIKGDQCCFSIAAASIIAKVTRDNWMAAAHQWLPAYGFARHKGYGTEEHRAALLRHGPSPIHRFSYAPVAQLVQGSISACPEEGC